MKHRVLRFAVLSNLLLLLFGVTRLQANELDKPVACQNSFAGVVFFDQNRDGIRSVEERYVPGQIEIVDEQGATQQTITTNDGTFGAHQLACNTYMIHHNHVAVGAVVVGEVMSQEIKMFPKAQTLFFPITAYKGL